MRHTLVAVWDAEVRAGTGHQPALAVSGSSKIMKETEGLCSHSPLDSHLFWGNTEDKNYISCHLGSVLCSRLLLAGFIFIFIL